MSVIWRARDEVLDRVVALKVLAPSLAADARFRDMVREEARAAAQLVHPHVTSVHDYGETVAPDGSITSFVVMELLSGEELELPAHRGAAALAGGGRDRAPRSRRRWPRRTGSASCTGTSPRPT